MPKKRIEKHVRQKATERAQVEGEEGEGGRERENASDHANRERKEAEEEGELEAVFARSQREGEEAPALAHSLLNPTPEEETRREKGERKPDGCGEGDNGEGEWKGVKKSARHREREVAIEAREL